MFNGAIIRCFLRTMPFGNRKIDPGHLCTGLKLLFCMCVRISLREAWFTKREIYWGIYFSLGIHPLPMWIFFLNTRTYQTYCTDNS